MGFKKFNPAVFALVITCLLMGFQNCSRAEFGSVDPNGPAGKAGSSDPNVPNQDGPNDIGDDDHGDGMDPSDDELPSSTSGQCGDVADVKRIMVNIESIKIILDSGSYIVDRDLKTLDLAKSLSEGLPLDLSVLPEGVSGHLVALRIKYIHSGNYVVSSSDTMCELKTNCGQHFMIEMKAAPGYAVEAGKKYAVKADFSIASNLRANPNKYFLRPAFISITDVVPLP